MKQEDAIICRCEEVTVEEIRRAIEAGDRSLREIKNRTRAGMGFCQGKTCRRLIARILAAETGRPLEQILDNSARVPVGPLPLGLIAATVDGTEEI
jgi:NAD(P)H-nitrite reductase large subunit